MTTTAAQAKSATTQVEAGVARQINRLQREYAVQGAQPTPWAASTLAALRRSTPGRVDDDSATWAVVFGAVPDDLVFTSDSVEVLERTAHAALVLYAIHQASQPRPMHVAGIRLGQALRRLPNAEDERGGVLRRFGSLVGASTPEAALYHLRSLMSLLRREGIAVDHVALFRDVVRLHSPRTAASVRRQWGRDFFSRSSPTPGVGESGNPAQPTSDSLDSI